MIRTISFSLGLLVVIGSFVLGNKLRETAEAVPSSATTKGADDWRFVIRGRLWLGGVGTLGMRVRAPERGISRVMRVVA